MFCLAELIWKIESEKRSDSTLICQTKADAILMISLKLKMVDITVYNNVLKHAKFHIQNSLNDQV